MTGRGVSTSRTSVAERGIHGSVGTSADPPPALDRRRLEHVAVAHLGAWLAVIGLVAVAIRVAVVLAVESRHFYGYDAQWYHLVANHLADGDGFVIGGEAIVGGLPLTPWLEPRATAFFPPAYPAVLALPSALGVDTLLGHQIATSVLGAATVVLVGLLARRLAGDVAGVVAASIAALHPLLIGADAALMSESLYGAVVAGLLLLAYRALDVPSTRRFAALGALGAAAALTRNEGLVLAIAVIAVTAWSVRRRAARVGWWGPALAIVLVVGVVGAWTARNVVQVDGARALATNPGATIAGGNCEETYFGSRLGGWHYFCLALERWHASGADEADFYGDLASEGIDYATDHAGRLPVVTAARFGRVIELHDAVGEARVAGFEGRHFKLELAGVGAFHVTVAGAIAGLMLLARRRFPIAILLAPVVAVCAAALLHGNPRVRFAAEPVLVVASAVAIVATFDRFLARRRDRV